jgi:hypothetical protein
MLAIGFGRREALAKLPVAGVIQAPFAGIVLRAPDAVDGIVRPIALVDRVTEDAAEQANRTRRCPLAAGYDRPPPAAADFPLMTSRKNRPPSEEVKSLTVRLPISGMICRWIRPLSASEHPHQWAEIQDQLAKCGERAVSMKT